MYYNNSQNGIDHYGSITHHKKISQQNSISKLKMFNIIK